jgi:hypothetical protein
MEMGSETTDYEGMRQMVDSFSGYLDSKRMPERAGVCLTDMIDSTRKLSEAFPDHRVRVNVFFHEYYDGVIDEYVFPVVVMGEFFKDDKPVPFGAMYERIFWYSNPDPKELEKKEEEVGMYVKSLAKVFEDFGIEATLVPQLPEGYERFHAGDADAFEAHELSEDDIWFMMGVMSKEDELDRNGDGEEPFRI